ncbi:tRNA (adenosine(37)-N6)-threonylcarbamoyltransferase complex dimerization subunit type 1 TsaB [Plantibacter sp. ME-Dv--P-095]|uniref:tRNA (adenosine(37)-N6)-threonylcarbamoyltransferase complex dimerization subunit type 1 TsaB n=1 Tax=Plantibacter sp. ME-Dv--P-095 TaxID=3040299 RepID=UPI00254CE460|nr:tRNA (adenosine(37)-N6)-threonylcarbamoyltransferase complex dimerization subunit type 1 TsaB [Plantibacter sp. ME-Dv--P-095]
MLLAIDTSAGSSVAVVSLDGVILAERSSDDPMRHAEVIGTLIAGSLDEAGVAVADLTGVVAGMGPGPFTGLRIGIAAARSFGVGAGLPVHPVVSHDGIALDAYGTGRAAPDAGLLVVTDARRRERYWSAYAGLDANGLPVRAQGPALAKPKDLPSTEAVRFDAVVVPAGALGRIAALLLASDGAFAGEEPLYLRSPDVTMSTGAKRVTA